MSEHPPRSTFVTVVAWIFIALSGIATAISILQNIMVRTIFSSAELDHAVQSAPPDAPPFAVFLAGHMQLFFLAFLLVSALMLVSSVGLLRRWNWARLCFIALMAVAIAWQLAGLGVQITMFSSMRQQFAAASNGGGPDLGGFLIAIAVFGFVFAAGISVLLGWIIRKLVSAPIVAEFRR